MQWSTSYEIFEACIFGVIGATYKHRISNTSSLAIKVSSEKALELRLGSDSHHKTTFSKFESFGCAF